MIVPEQGVSPSTEDDWVRISLWSGAEYCRVLDGVVGNVWVKKGIKVGGVLLAHYLAEPLKRGECRDNGRVG